MFYICLMLSDCRHRPEFQRIAGTEMLETCFLVNELILKDAKVP